MDDRVRAIPHAYRVEGDRLLYETSPIGTIGSSSLGEELGADLYARHYAQLPTTEHREHPIDWDVANSLIEAIDTHERWDAGWTCQTVNANGAVSITKDAEWRLADPGDYRRDPAGRPLSPGSRIAVLVRPYDLDAQPGSIYMHGREVGDRAARLHLGRWYLNLGVDEAVLAVEYLTRRLNEFEVPFTLKCPTRRAFYERVDSMVLYGPLVAQSLICRILREAEQKAELAEPVPLFTQRLGQGIGFAEDPGGGESFGMHRCHLMGEALVEHLVEGTQWSKALCGRLEGAGIDPRQPWLSPGSTNRIRTELAVRT